MLEHLFNLKFAAKDLERNAKKCEKQEKEEKNKLKKVYNDPDIDNIQCICMYLCTWTIYIKQGQKI